MHTVQITANVVYLAGLIASLALAIRWCPMPGRRKITSGLGLLTCIHFVMLLFVFARRWTNLGLGNVDPRAFYCVSSVIGAVGMSLIAAGLFQLHRSLQQTPVASHRTERSTQRPIPWISLAATATVFVGLSMPWARVSRTVEVTGWSTTANFLGLTLPGSLVALASLIALILLVVRYLGAGDYSLVSILFCGYGIFHVCFMMLALSATPGMRFAEGTLATIAGLALLIASSFIKGTSASEDAPATRPERLERVGQATA